MIVILNFHDVSGQDDKWDITMFHSTSEKKDYAFAASVSSRRLYHNCLLYTSDAADDQSTV